MLVPGKQGWATDLWSPAVVLGCLSTQGCNSWDMSQPSRRYMVCETVHVLMAWDREAAKHCGKPRGGSRVHRELPAGWHVISVSRGRVFQAANTASAKALGAALAWC